MPPQNSKQWAARCAALVDDQHLRSQVSRIMEPLRLIHGTRECPSFEEVLNTASQLVALLELNPEMAQTPNNGGLVAARGPRQGYSLLLHAADVYALHLSPYSTSMGYWNDGEAVTHARIQEQHGL